MFNKLQISISEQAQVFNFTCEPEIEVSKAASVVCGNGDPQFIPAVNQQVGIVSVFFCQDCNGIDNGHDRHEPGSGYFPDDGAAFGFPER